VVSSESNINVNYCRRRVILVINHVLWFSQIVIRVIVIVLFISVIIIAPVVIVVLMIRIIIIVSNT